MHLEFLGEGVVVNIQGVNGHCVSHNQQEVFECLGIEGTGVSLELFLTVHLNGKFGVAVLSLEAGQQAAVCPVLNAGVELCLDVLAVFINKSIPGRGTVEVFSGVVERKFVLNQAGNNGFNRFVVSVENVNFECLCHSSVEF